MNAQTYLLDLLALQALQPDLRTWSFEGLAHNPPRRLRYEQLLALHRGLELSGSLTGHLDGSFLYRQPLAATAWLFDGARYPAQDPGEVKIVYRGLVGLLRRLGRLAESGVLAAPRSYALVQAFERQVVDQQRGLYDKLLAQLGRVLDPWGREFTREQLVADHAYPTQDLADLEADWR